MVAGFKSVEEESAQATRTPELIFSMQIWDSV